MKIINLDDQRNAIKIIVSGKEYEISRLTLRARDLIVKWKTESMRQYYDIQNFILSLETAVDPKRDLKQNQNRLKKMTDDFEKNKATMTQDLATVTREAIEKVLTDNNYGYEPDFWESDVDADEPTKFLNAVFEKDAPEGAKKGATVK